MYFYWFFVCFSNVFMFFYAVFFINKRCDFFCCFCANVGICFRTTSFVYCFFLSLIAVGGERRGEKWCCGLRFAFHVLFVCLFMLVLLLQSVLCLNVCICFHVFVCTHLLCMCCICICISVYVVIVCVYLFTCINLFCKCWWIQLISVIYSCI